MTYCFDLDGTLCDTAGMDYMAAKPFRDVIERVNNLYKAGHRIIIDTARGYETGKDWTGKTRKQLDGWGVRYHELRCGQKIPADFYVDDRAICAVHFRNRMSA